MIRMKKLWILLSFSLLSCTAVSAANDKTNDKAALKAARALIGRVTPGYEQQYVLERIPADPATGEDVFEIDSDKKGKVVLRGNNPVALASAFHWYLKYTCGAQLSWFGDQLNLPERLPRPARKERRTIAGREYLEAVGRRISTLIDDFDPTGIVAMQAWSIREPIVRQFPKERLVVLDLNGSTYPGKENFWGYPFVADNLHNFGGRINLHGDLPLVASNQYRTARLRAANAVGSGLFMESIVQNPVYYALAFEMPMHRDSIDAAEWLDAYTTRAYGAESEAAKRAWRILSAGPYGPGTNGVESSSIIAARPDIDVKKSGPNAGFRIPYDPKSLYEAERLLLQDSAQLGGSSLYRFDVMDLQRQIMSNLGQEIHRTAAAVYKTGDKAAFKKHSERFLELLLDVDTLLASRTEWNFDRWISDARGWGTTAEEQELLERDATALVTYWGFTPGYTCQQFDYSWREWAGLIRRYYYGRWQQFYEMLEASLEAGVPYSEAGTKMSHGREAFRGNAFYDKLADWEIAFVATPKTDIDPTPRGDEIELARRMFDKYTHLAKEYYR